MDEKQVRSDPSSDLAKIWERLCKHIFFLKKHQVLLNQEVKNMFGTLLISERNVQDDQVIPLLKEVLPKACEDGSSIHSDESSYSSPSILNDTGEINPAKQAQWLDNTGTREQELTSWGEDENQEESLVEKISITGLNIGSNSLKKKQNNEIISEASFSSSQGRSPLSRVENKRRMVTPTKSKAFWGESDDDSNSDIEAALRPPALYKHEDDFDEYYD
uniref:Centrosomal protein kizuna n=1 Tax=Sphenodon punctatus TaxID=8508 RepID=A0A8D0GDK6_SPHPU